MRARQAFGARLVLLIRLPHVAQQLRRRSGTPVEPGSLQLRRNQSQLLSLGVDAQELGGEGSEESEGHRPVIDEDPIAAAAAYLTSHGELRTLHIDTGVGQD